MIIDKIEKNAHMLSRLAKSYDKVMQGCAYWKTENEARTYIALRKEQEDLVKALQEENTP